MHRRVVWGEPLVSRTPRRLEAARVNISISLWSTVSPLTSSQHCLCEPSLSLASAELEPNFSRTSAELQPSLSCSSGILRHFIFCISFGNISLKTFDILRSYWWSHFVSRMMWMFLTPPAGLQRVHNNTGAGERRSAAGCLRTNIPSRKIIFKKVSSCFFYKITRDFWGVCFYEIFFPGLFLEKKFRGLFYENKIAGSVLAWFFLGLFLRDLRQENRPVSETQS